LVERLQREVFPQRPLQERPAWQVRQQETRLRVELRWQQQELATL
jgi:hypothetical protein